VKTRMFYARNRIAKLLKGFGIHRAPDDRGFFVQTASPPNARRIQRDTCYIH